VTVTVPSITAATTCAATDLVVVTQPEYAGFVADHDVAVAAQSTASAALVAATSSTVNPDVIQAEMVLFGATLTACAIVFGLKRVYRLLVPADGAGHE
jgi:hypothetical protein